MFAGYVLFGWGLARVRASTATTVSLAETVVAAILAVVIVGERLPVLAWAGAALVAGSLFVLTLPATMNRHGRAEEIPSDGGRPVPATPTRA
jgi:DME family drug/metabolite transporter